ncbi:MAG: 3-deoxy-7-phosphoheptulonate synthase [Bacteroidota bacterium]
MVIVLKEKIKEEEIKHISDVLTEFGFAIHRSDGEVQTILGAIGAHPEFDKRMIEVLPGVESVFRITEPYKLVSRSFKPDNTIIKIKDVEIGGKNIIVMAGPCSIESEKQIFQIAESIKKSGAKILRGGAFKPRTSPYAFQGMGVEGLKLMQKAGEEYGLLTITEVMDASQIEIVAEYSDIFQIGARNMQNFSFLKELGKTRKPILLKRGISATYDEWLMAAEYILAGGNFEMMFCERGIRTFETGTRNTMDIGAIPVIQKRSHLPVIADPSHGIGIRDKVIPMARASVAAGADGLIIEVHNDPDHAKSDGAQSLFPKQFDELMKQSKIIAEAIGRTLV